jgi:TolA-binding protein
MASKSRRLLRQISVPLWLIIVIVATPLPSSASSPQELLLVGTGAFNEGFYPVAEAQFRTFLQTYPQHNHASEVIYLLGKALYEQKKYAEARGVFNELLASSKAFRASDTVYFWLSRTCEKLGDQANAQNNLLTLVTRYPQSPWYPPSLFLLGKISFQEGQYKRAEMYLKKSLQERKITPSLSASAKFWLGLTLYEQKRYKESEDLFQDVVDSKFKEDLLEEALYWWGENLIKLQKYKKGAAAFRALLDRCPQSPFTAHALYGESLCLYMCERKEEALRGLLTLKNNFSHTPLLPHVLSFTGVLYIDLNRYQEAIEVLKEFLSRFPQAPMRVQTLLDLGWCYLKRGDYARVKEITYEIVKLSPAEREKALAQYILAELNTYEGNCQEAMPYWFNLLNTSLYRQEALFKIAACSFQEGKYKESLVNIDLLQLEYPNFYKMDECLWIQGESFRELGNITEASKAYVRAVKEYKKSLWQPWCLYRLIAILTHEEDIRQSERYFEILRKKHPLHELFYDAALKVAIKKAEKADYESSLNYLVMAAQSPNKNVVKNAVCWQGEIYFDFNEYRKAMESYERALVENPSSENELDALTFVEMGNIRYLLDDQKQAKEAYKKAIDCSHDDMLKEQVKLLLKEIKSARRGGT